MKRLKKIYIEITNACNLSCPFCPPHSRGGRFMGEAEFSRIAEKLRGAAPLVYFHVKGEPLLHPLVGEFIDIAERSGFAVNITTNGTLLKEKAAELAGRKNLARLNVSLHSLAAFLPEERSEILAGMLDGAEQIIAGCREQNPSFLVSYRLWNADRPEETDQTLAALAKFYAIEPESIRQKLAASNGFRIHDNAAIHTAETFSWPDLSGEDFGERGFCRGLRDQAGILADGTVVPCCLDGDGVIGLGNIFESDFSDILDSPRAQALHDSFTDRKISEPLCRRCGYRTRFSK